MPSIQEFIERPQFGGVISRIVALSLCSAFLDGKTATSSLPTSREQRKLKPRN